MKIRWAALILTLVPGVACSTGPEAGGSSPSRSGPEEPSADASILKYGEGGGYGGGGGTGGDYNGPGTYGCGVTPPDPNALLWSSRGGSPQWDFCCGKPDSEPLPTDPRSLVQPGVSDGRNVVFNGWWQDCHVDPEAVGEFPHPTTCGELRAFWEEGRDLLVPGSPGVSALFIGSNAYALDSLFGLEVISSTTWNNLWRQWGFPARPPNFDYLLAQRYGSPMGAERNPYPLPGENPNWTNGGSGQLPIMFTQIRLADGTWTGDIGVTCQGCHNGMIGSPSDAPGLGMQVGGGSSTVDWDVFLGDLLPHTADYLPAIATLANLNRTRGTNNASDVNIAFLFPDEEPYSFQTLIGLLTSGSTAGIDTPAWWNGGHRPRKFQDAVFPMDNPRIDMVFYTPFLGLFGALGGPVSEGAQDWMRTHGQAAQHWLESLKSPRYPTNIDPIDTQLAEQGAVIFHELNLWDPARNNTHPAPPQLGNGSCASCHGAYAPRYFNDPAYLATPALEGVASNITPIEVIGTDPARLSVVNQGFLAAGDVNFFGMPPTVGTENDCSPIDSGGYLAPPLYGIWANAPYLHNGSVPNLWQLLEPSDRPEIWERVSTPKPSGWQGLWYWTSSLQAKALMNYDTNLSRAFDFDQVGWDYVEHTCEEIVRTCTWWGQCTTYTPRLYLQCGITEAVNNSPLGEEMVEFMGGSGNPLGWLLDFLNANVIAFWNLFTPPTRTMQQLEERKIYNTNHYGLGNEGHEFTDVLTDQERWALIEYLKTL